MISGDALLALLGRHAGVASLARARKLCLIWLGVLFFGAAPAFAQLAVPPLTARVIDTTATLSDAQRGQLEATLSAFEASHGSQIVILMVPTTQPEEIAAYANRVASDWKIGRKTVGDGLLLIVAKNDRKLRIEVARALEGAVPDLAAKRIIDRVITPEFRLGNYAQGLNGGLEQIMALIKGEALPTPDAVGAQPKPGFDWTDLAVFLFIAVPVVGSVTRGMLGRKLGALVTGGIVGLVAAVVTASLLIAALAALAALLFSLFSGVSQRLGVGSGHHGGWGDGPGGGFGGGGGGGFSSGGGGSFGGGGASGDW